MSATRMVIRAALVSAVSIQGLLGYAANAQSGVSTGVEDIIITAQRQAQSLQDVPVAVTAFSMAAMEEKQINNAQQLQLSLPNITFSKGNFTGSSFTIRGVGDLCVGTTCDSATAIHMNDLPLFGTRIFETEYFDLERVEVLRGPQGTLFGRNATSGVVNFVSAKPELDDLKARVEGGYGNYNELRFQGMLNVPITRNLGVRFAGMYLKRDGYTENLYDNTKHDGRDMYALRGSLRWEPTPDTTVDLMGYYFREDDNRMRIQKQMCQRDPTGVLGCLPYYRANEFANGNAGFTAVLASKELLQIQGGPAFGETLAGLALGSVYGEDIYAYAKNPSDPRKIYTDYAPTYFAEEIQAQAKIEHDFGGFKAKLSGAYNRNRVDSSQDYSMSVTNAALFQPALTNLAALAQVMPAFQTVLDHVTNGSEYCTSVPNMEGSGVYGGSSYCSATPQDFDRSRGETEAYTLEAIVSTDFDSPFNFLVGGIYNNATLRDHDYSVVGWPMDYITGVLAATSAVGTPALGNVYLGSPFYYNNTDRLFLKSWGLFGEAYWEASDKLKFTVGLRYNNDRKQVRARSTLASFPVPVGVTDIFESPYAASYDADPGKPGNQLWQEREANFSELTGRFVVDYKVTDDNLLYASYSRGYKSGGINPPMQDIFEVPESFAPEFIDAFEIGSKNRFADGALQLNATAFYYKYKGLQLARNVARTTVNDNVNANIWGVEVEGVVRPIEQLAINMGFSYLSATVSQDRYLSDTFDPSGGRSDAVIIKDISNGANCAVIPTGEGGAPLSNGYVTAVNSALGLRAPTAFPDYAGMNGATGAFSMCSVLSASAADAGVSVISPGIETNVKGNHLPQAPTTKASLGVQWTETFSNGMSLVPRVDMAFTGESYGSIFNNARTRIESYYVMNAQIQLNGPDDRWFVRGYIQNIQNNNAITGVYSTDQSSANFTNIFTLEPRRYGITAGFNF